MNLMLCKVVPHLLTRLFLISSLFLQKTTYVGSGKTKELVKTVSELQRQGIEANDRDVFNGLSLHIPPLPPSFLGGCRIIDIKYFLTVSFFCLFFIFHALFKMAINLMCFLFFVFISNGSQCYHCLAR